MRPFVRFFGSARTASSVSLRFDKTADRADQQTFGGHFFLTDHVLVGQVRFVSSCNIHIDYSERNDVFYNFLLQIAYVS